MPLNDTWYELQTEKTDLENVVAFLKAFPDTFQQLFSPDTSNFESVINKDNEAGISSFQFDNAFRTARELFLTSVNVFESQSNAAQLLSTIGFTGESLQMKLALLNNLWSRLRIAMRFTGFTSINYWVKRIAEALKKLLKYINSLLGSLSTIISGLDPIKELKEVIENYLENE